MSKPRKRNGRHYAQNPHARPFQPWKGAPRYIESTEEDIPTRPEIRILINIIGPIVAIAIAVIVGAWWTR